MVRHFIEPILHEPISHLNFSHEFTVVTEIFGFHTLADLLQRHTGDLLQLPGFTEKILYEFVDFMEDHRIGHYIDP